MVVAHLPVEDLHLSTQPAESGTVDNSVTVSLERAAIRVWRLRVLPFDGVAAKRRIGSQQGLFTLVDRSSNLVHLAIRRIFVGGSSVSVVTHT